MTSERLPLYTTSNNDNLVPPEFSPRRGAMMVALSSYLFSFIHVGAKVLSQDGLTVTQIILLRCIPLNFIVWLAIKYYKIPYGFWGPPEARKLLTARAVLGYLGLIAFFNSIALLRLGDAVTLSFTIPILMVVLAVFLLGEPVKCTDIVAILLGIAGVVCVAQPEMIFGRTPIHVLYDIKVIGYFNAGLSALLNSYGNVLVRKIGNSVHSLHVVAYFMFIPFFPSAIYCYFFEYHLMVWPSSTYSWFWFWMMAFGALFGQLLFSRALQLAPVNYVTPFMFLQVIFAFLNDYFLFQLDPPAWSLVGAILVALSVFVSSRS